MNQEAILDVQDWERFAQEQQGKYLTFFTDNQLFGISIVNVVQIIGLQNITPIPEFPHYAKGIVHLRGEIIPVIDMRLRLNRAEQEYYDRTCIIVTNIENTIIGFIVDGLDAVIDLQEQYISEPPHLKESASTSFIEGIAHYNEKIILLMNLEKMIKDDISLF